MSPASVIFLVLVGVHWSLCFTISSESDPSLPTQIILDGEIVRKTSYNEIIYIRCPSGTILDKTTSTCKFLEADVNTLNTNQEKRKKQETCVPGKTKKPILPAFEDCRYSFLLACFGYVGS
ncbi:unnamed protein product [Acanthoscelides obtectus]|uniref:Sushi domain-containing protein n=1 Tax=Acanthoscelides obtectus TaxID=200917 RepID=A0A9P0NZP5_ACAOB|nr:unnamed protein product [Acanthoscelides obtectus]CAK1639488.1 hypothetical protein AOBTE_LOCUS11213 [Acanthoscelides obtectus]